MNRRQFVELATALGATLAWGRAAASASKVTWTERRELFPQGVASGDPHPDSVLLWTRRPPVQKATAKSLTVEVATDRELQNVVATSSATLSAANDWTCRVLAAGLKPSSVYWYRFTDNDGQGSRIGRTCTAPAHDDPRPVRFTFVSCQNVCQGAQNAYRRMIYEDDQQPDTERLDFVLHLGDFIYEVIWYPEDRPQGMYERRLRDLVRFAQGEKIRDFHVPVTLDDYRSLYRAYLQDPDLQDARARWPFVCVWDNHEFSWKGFQGFAKVDAAYAAQTRKVFANQSWFEYQPARIAQPGGAELQRFEPPSVVDAPVERFDDRGLGQEPNNLAAINSLLIYRRLRFGRHVDLVLTDNRSFQSESALDRPEAAPFRSGDFPNMIPEEVVEIFDAGRDYNGGRPPDTIRYGDKDLPNPRKNSPPQTMLGDAQKSWFLQQLRESTATWKIWGNSLGTLEYRTDPQNLPEGLTKPWGGSGYASLGGGDWTGYLTERGEIYQFVRDHRITGFAIVSGDRHSFWAGLAAQALPPKKLDPIGLSFVTGSISAPAMAESMEYTLPKNHPLRPLYLLRRPSEASLQRTMNMLLMHGVRSCMEFARSGDYWKAMAQSNPDVAPHLSFLDLGGHGYAKVRAASETLDVEFVCIPRPIERSPGNDGGPLVYRVAHQAKLWKAGQTPKLERTLLEGMPPLSI